MLNTPVVLMRYLNPRKVEPVKPVSLSQYKSLSLVTVVTDAEIEILSACLLTRKKVQQSDHAK